MPALLAQGTQGGLLNTPPWPVNGDISGYPGSQSVFLDFATAEYVVALKGPNGKVEETLRTAQHNRVDASIAATVSQEADGTFRYRYEVSNGPNALMAVQSWALAMLESVDKTRVVDGIWPGGVSKEKLSGISRDDHVVFRWTSPTGKPLAPGSRVRYFELISDLAPGFILSSFRGQAQGHELTQEEWAHLPVAAADQLKLAMGTAWDTQTTMVIGPCFQTSADYRAVASNFSLGAQIYLDQIVDEVITSRVRLLLDESISASIPLVSGDARIRTLKAMGIGKSQNYLGALELTLNAISRQ